MGQKKFWFNLPKRADRKKGKNVQETAEKSCRGKKRAKSGGKCPVWDLEGEEHVCNFRHTQGRKPFRREAFGRCDVFGE